MVKIGRILMGVCQTNCYFLYEEGKKEVLFVDPADHGDVIYEKLEKAGFDTRTLRSYLGDRQIERKDRSEGLRI